MITPSDYADLEIKCRGLENENRNLRHKQLDDYAQAALTGLLARGWEPFDMAVEKAFSIARQCLKERNS